jgi:hypothetical protein
MKFMTVGTFKDTFSALPQDEKTRQTVQAVEWILDLKKKMGNKFHFYGTVGWNRTVSIGEYDSVEEYYQTLQSPNAQAGYMNYECYALIEADEQFLNSYLEQAKAA